MGIHSETRSPPLHQVPDHMKHLMVNTPIGHLLSGGGGAAGAPSTGTVAAPPQAAMRYFPADDRSAATLHQMETDRGDGRSAGRGRMAVAAVGPTSSSTSSGSTLLADGAAVSASSSSFMVAGQPTLQQVIDACPAGGCVVIRPGRHIVTEPLLIRRPIQIMGYEAGNAEATPTIEFPADVTVGAGQSVPCLRCATPMAVVTLSRMRLRLTVSCASVDPSASSCSGQVPAGCSSSSSSALECAVTSAAGSLYTAEEKALLEAERAAAQASQPKVVRQEKMLEERTLLDVTDGAHVSVQHVDVVCEYGHGLQVRRGARLSVFRGSLTARLGTAVSSFSPANVSLRHVIVRSSQTGLVSRPGVAADKLGGEVNSTAAAGSTVVVEHGQFQRCNVGVLHEGGALGFDAPTVLITDTVFIECEIGCTMSDASVGGAAKAPKIHGSTFQHCGRGVHLEGCMVIADITKNHFTACRDAGLCIDGGKSIVAHNQFQQMPEFAIEVIAGKPCVESNVIRECSNGIFVAGSSSEPTLRGNIFQGMARQHQPAPLLLRLTNGETTVEHHYGAPTAAHASPPIELRGANQSRSEFTFNSFDPPNSGNGVCACIVLEDGASPCVEGNQCQGADIFVLVRAGDASSSDAPDGGHPDGGGEVGGGGARGVVSANVISNVNLDAIAVEGSRSFVTVSGNRVVNVLRGAGVHVRRGAVVVIERNTFSNTQLSAVVLIGSGKGTKVANNDVDEACQGEVVASGRAFATLRPSQRARVEIFGDSSDTCVITK